MNTPLFPGQQPREEPNQHRHDRSRFLRVLLRLAAGFAVLAILVVVALAIVVRTAWFHNYVLSKAQSWASEELGTQVELENFSVHLSTLRIDVYGLTVRGADPHPNPPLLQVQHAEVCLGTASVLHRKWYLSALDIDRPIVKIIVDANGNSNIPRLKGGGGSSHISAFDLGIRHATLTNGIAFFNDRQRAVSADLHNVNFHAVFNPISQKYSGALSYTGGRLTAASLNTIPHNLDARFSATPSTFQLDRATLTIGKSQFGISAKLQNYTDPDIQGQYDFLVDGGDIGRILHNPSLPAGLIRASGSMRYHRAANRPLLDSIFMNGSVSSRQLDVQTSSLRARLSEVSAQYSLAGGDAAIRAFHARLLGGELLAAMKMTALGGDSHSQVSASLRNISLEDIRRMLRSGALPKDIVIGGALNSQLNASWGKTLADLTARAHATVDGRISNAHVASGEAVIPLNSAIQGAYNRATGEVSLTQSYLHLPQTSLAMNGVMSRHSNVAVKLQSGDLHELEMVTDLFLRPEPGKKLPSVGLSGTATFNGTISGSTSAPHLVGELAASNLRVHGTAWRSLRTDVDVSPSLAQLQNAQLEPALHGRLTLNAGVGLKKWAFVNTSPVQVQLNGSQLNVAELTKAAGVPLPVTGVLDVNIKMHGTELHPVGQGNATLSHLTYNNEPIQSLQVNVSGTGDQVNGNLAASLPAGKLQCTASIRPQEKSYAAQLSADNIRLEKLASLKARGLNVSGGITLHASGNGSFGNPQFEASIQASQLNIQAQPVTGVNVQMNLADHIATANVSAQVIHTALRANAKVALTGDYLADAALDTQAIPLQPLVAIYAPNQAPAISGETEVHATLRGPLKDKKLLQVHIRIPTLKVGYNNTIQLAAASPIDADYKNGIISVQHGAVRGTDTDLQFEGSIPTTGNQPMSLLLLGTVDLHILQLADADLKSSGQLKFNIGSHGGASTPNFAGQIQIVDVNLARTDLPVGLENGNGVLTLNGDRLVISQFQAVVGSGTVTAEGGVTYRPTLQANLGVSAKNIRVLYPAGVREEVSADLRLVGSQESATLGGAVNISDLSFTPAFDLTDTINRLSGGIATPPSTGLTQNVRLNLSVHSSNNLSLVSKALSINGAANLQVVGTAAQPVILGRINLNSGDVIFNGDRFVLNGGTIQFVNPSQTQPVVNNLALNTTVQQYTIYMQFNGPVDQLHTNYSSDPSLPAADIINLLAFGQTTEANAANGATPANQAAESLVASQVSSEVTSRVSKVAGISQLSINPVLAGGTTQGPPGANVTIQQRVSGNLFVTFSSNLASTQNETIMGQYQLSPRVAVSATRDQNGGFALDTTIKKTW